MSRLLQHWSVDPFLFLLAVIVIVHARGVRHLFGAMQRAGRDTKELVGQALLFWASLLVTALAVVSPVDYWADQYLSAHVVQHILLSFVAPPLLVIGSPWLPLLGGLPRSWRNALGRLSQRTSSRSGARSKTNAATKVRRLLARPLTSVVLFNFTMILWHLPGPFDAAAGHPMVHIFLEHGSFFGFGVALWLQIFGSRPFRPQLPGPQRVAALIATNGVMVIVAATLVLFTSNAYPWYAIGHTVAQQAADQQIGGAILWVCGEIAFLPATLYLISQWLKEEPTRKGQVSVPSPDSVV